MKVAIYARVSTNEQTTENQVKELREWSDRAGHEIVTIYDDNGVSGAKGREYRKEFDKLLKGAVRREFDLVAAWSVDRLGRSLQDLVSFLQDLHGAGGDMYLHQQALDTTTPSGKAMFQMMGVFAEFERSMISERVKSGLARAKINGKKLGRPNLVPLALVRANPLLTRSLIIDRSNSANTPIIWNMALPLGVVVSSAC